MKIAIYPGSFDPVTNGHLDIINRASKLFDKVIVLVSININKHYIFDKDEKIKYIQKAIKGLDNVAVDYSDDLVVRYAKDHNASIIIRGVRNHNDFDSEMQLGYINKQLDNDIETLLMFPDKENLFISATTIKECVMFNVDISKYVPSCIKDEIELKLKERLHK